MGTIVYLIASFLAVAVVLTLHEFAHAFVAYQCGDPTPKWNGRLSVNPLRHFDIAGLLCFAFVGFGWAKPVPINPYNFKKYRSGLAWTAAAGVLMNYITAFLFYPLFLLVLQYVLPAWNNYFSLLLQRFTYLLFSYSLSFCVFNLLPFYPLDGFRLVDALDKRHGKVYQFLRKYGYYILLALIFESFLCEVCVNFGIRQMEWFDILGYYFMTFAKDYLGWPITALWGLVF